MRHREFLKMILPPDTNIHAMALRAKIPPTTVASWRARESWPRLDVFLKFVRANGLLKRFVTMVQDKDFPLFKGVK